MNKKVFIPLPEGFEEIEFISIIDTLRRADIIVKSASITDDEYVKGGHDIIIKADTTFNKVDINEFDAISLPGGGWHLANPEKSKNIINAIKKMHADKKLVSAVCAAPIVLGEAGVLHCKYTCYPSYEKYIATGEYTDETDVVVSENIITSRGPATSILFALEIIKYLLGENKYIEVKDKLLVK